ncbi:MAG: hypothetical protein KDC87_06535 [Planctomycetes bacterium]|nr:hypothetical protein [Planctomycetota bacterium]MCB9870526.1 hypothetical protein [Planctomycetota bacterium]
MRVPVTTPSDTRPRRITTLLLGLGALLVCSVAVLGSYSWLATQTAGAVESRGGQPTPSVWTNLGTLFREALPRQRAADAKSIPQLTFDIKFKNVRKLARKRATALGRGYLIQEEGDYVAANVRVVDGADRYEVRTRIRLKGDFTDHIEGDKWSFRVQVKGGGQILGMRVFSIQHPKVRGYLHEPIFLEHMRSEGVLAPRYRFVRVVVNGNDKGIMALEEHFAKELLESQQRRASVIVRFDEALKWRTLFMMGQEVNFAAPYPLITPFRGGEVEKSPTLQADLRRATGLLRAFLDKTLPPSRVFDPAVTARFLAVCEVWGAEHALVWNNLRFYYNPITGLLEPIAFDANLQDYAFRFISTALVSVFRLGDNVSADWLEDPRIRAPFLRELHRIATQFRGDKVQATFRTREQQLAAIVHAEFPLIAPIPFDFYKLRAERLLHVDDDNLRILPLMPPNYPVLLHAFVRRDPAGWILELYNLVPYPLQIEAVRCEPVVAKAAIALPLTLPPTRDMTAPTPTRIQLTVPDAAADVAVHVTARIPGYPDQRRELRATHYPAIATHAVLPEVGWEEVARLHPYLVRDKDGARLGPGRIQIDRPLVLPSGAALTVAAGTTLAFADGALILCRGALHMTGTAQDPIRLHPTGERWRGVAVLGSGAKCSWSHVQVERTGGLRLGEWQTTGSVMFYECDVQLRDCSIRDNHSEDALNLVRSTFALERVDVIRTTSDAIDMDFCRGVVRGGTIRDAAGDGIDVSGTTIEVDGTAFDGVKDKALSVGEQSTMKVRSVTVRRAGTGVASKDGSKTELRQSTFEEIVHVALMAYVKKPEFGPGTIDAHEVTIRSAKNGVLAQVGSRITVDGRVIQPVELDVDALYKTGHMRKN